MVDLDIKKDGYVSGQQLETILESMVAELGKVFDVVGGKLEKQQADIKRLQSELDAERRLRLSAGRR